MKNAKELLRLVTDAIPPSRKALHNLTLHDGELRLSLIMNDYWLSFDIANDDLERGVEELASEVVKEALDFDRKSKESGK